MSKIIAIGTANPPFCHQQTDIMHFMLEANNPDEKTKKLLPILYHRSGVDTRYSVFPDFSLPPEQWNFFGNHSSIPTLEKRMALYNEAATNLSIEAINNCLQNTDIKEITHLITVSCTGISVPGIDIFLVQ